MPWLVLSHLFHSVPTPTQASATAVQTHLCLSLSLCGAEIIEPSSCSFGERNPSLRSLSGLWATECKQRLPLLRAHLPQGGSGRILSSPWSWRGLGRLPALYVEAGVCLFPWLLGPFVRLPDSNRN